MALMQVAGPEGFDLSHAMLGHDALITRCRNTLLGAFMESTASHLLFVDADIEFAPAAVVRLLRATRDVVAGMYPIKSLNWSRAALNRQAHGEDGEAACLMYVGKPCEPAERETEAGFVTALVCRHRLHDGHPRRGCPDDRGLPANPLPGHPRLAAARRSRARAPRPVRHMIDPRTGAILSEDFAFCHRWRAIGGRIWLDTQCCLTHVGGFEFHGNPAARFAAPLSRTADSACPSG